MGNFILRFWRADDKIDEEKQKEKIQWYKKQNIIRKIKRDKIWRISNLYPKEIFKINVSIKWINEINWSK